MKNKLPGIFENAFPGMLESDDGEAEKTKHLGFSEDFFYEIAQNATDMILHGVCTPKPRYDYISPSCLSITGYSPEEFYADNLLIMRIIHPDDVHLILDPNVPGFKAPTEPIELRMIRKDGTIIWTEHMITYKRDTEGNLLTFQVIARDITERKKADESLQQSRIFTASLLEHAPHAIVVINADTSIRYVNPAWERINGWTLSEIIGLKAPYPWWPEELKEQWMPTFLDSFKQGTGKADLPAVKKNGEIYWIQFTGTNIYKDGKVDYMVINSIDVTEQKKAEKALQDSEAKFSRAFNTSPDIMAIIRVKDYKIIEVNEAFCKVSGYSREEAIGRMPSELNIWVSDEERVKAIKTIKEQGHIFNEEFRFNTSNNGVHPMLVSLEQIMVAEEPCYIFIATDITERKKTEAALQESEEKFATVYNTSPNAISLMSVPDYKFIEANESFFRLTGYTREEIIGRTYIDLELCAKLEDQIQIGRSLEDTGHVLNKRIGCRMKSGEIRAGLFSADTVEIGGKKRCIIVITDINDQVKTEEALRSSEEKFSKAFSSSPTAICLFNIETNQFIDANDSFTRFTGYAREEAVGRTPQDLNLWVNQRELESMNEKLQKNGFIINERIHSRMKSGDISIGLFSAQTFDVGNKKHMILSITDITDQVKAEEALKESEEKFAKAFRDSPEIIVITAINDGRFVDINDSYLHATGYSREELIGSNAKQINIWANEGELNERLRILMEQGKVTNKEYEFRTKSGEIRTWLYSAELVTIGGEPCMMSASIDITERKRIEQALANEEIRRRILIEQSSDGIVILDESGKVYDVNWRFAEMLGYTMEEASRLYVWDWEKGFTRENLLEQLKNVNSDGDHFTTHHLRKDGSYIDVDISTNGASFAGQKLIFCVCRDISERNRMEKALRESEEKFSLAFNASPHMIAITDLEEGKYVEVNDSYINATGYSREELIGRTLKDINIWANQEDVTDMVRYLERGSLKNKEYRFRTKSGEIRTWLCSADIVSIGGKQRILAMAADITERKKAEEALKASELRYRSLFENMTEGFALCQMLYSDGVPVDWFYHDINPAFERITGLKGATGKKVSELIPGIKETNPELFETYGRVARSGLPENFETYVPELGIYFRISVFSPRNDYFVAVFDDVTARKNAEKALRDSEEKFSRAFNTSPISLSISRMSDGKFLDVNESFLRDKGYTREEVIGKSVKELNIWASKEQQDSLIASLKANRRVHNIQMQFRTRSGEICDGLISAELIKIGNEDCMLVLNNDITQQKQAEEQLRLLSSVTKQITDSTMITDPQFNITYMNQAAEDMFGYTFEEVKGKNLSFFNQAPPTENFRKDIREILAAGKAHSDIIPKRRKDGTVIICDCKISPMYDENGHICNLIDVQRDITRQKDIEAKLQEHKKLIDSILATMPEGVLVVDNHDRILLANKAVASILHLNSKNLKNKSLSELLPMDQYFNLHRAVTYGNTENNTLEFRYHVQDVEKIIYCVIVKMDGERTLITFSDVSREREEEEKLYLTDRLASLGEMAAGLAHELNNPLTGILTLSQLLVGSDIPQEHKEDIECIYTEAKRAAGIVKNVLLFARVKADESGRASVNETVREVLRLREYEQRSSNIKVVTELEDNLPDITIDKGQLQQVFLNMISNAEAAIKEANRPGILTVITQRVNNHVNIQFTDNGCGIKKQVMPRIFDPFFTTKEVGKGTGLGLSICYSIIVKHGGKINVKSQVNEGTTFSIKMPVAS